MVDDAACVFGCGIWSSQSIHRRSNGKMNERIKQLIKQAGLNIDGYGDPIWGCLDGEDEKKDDDEAKDKDK